MASKDAEDNKDVKDIKTAKKRRPLRLILSDEEDKEDEDCQSTSGLFAKKSNALKSRLAQNRAESLARLAQDYDEEEDVFSDSKTGHVTKSSKKPNKHNTELAEVEKLLEELSQRSDQKEVKSDVENVQQSDQMVILDDSIIMEDYIDPSVSSNTRSGKGRGRGRATARGSGRGRGRKTTPKRTPPNNNRGRGRGRRGRNSLEYNEYNIDQAFEKLDGMQAMDEVEVIEELETSLNNSMSQEVEEFNKDRDIEIKVKYDAEIKRYSMKSNDKFSKVLPIIAETIKEKISNLMFILNDKVIDSESTPNGIGLSVSDIIKCHKRSTNKSIANGYKDPNNLTLKLRDKAMKNPETITINKFENISKLIELFAQSRETKPEKVVLEFDGDRLDPDSTIQECDIEDDSLIDVKILK